MTRIVGLVPMRHDSERVPGKNYRSFGGEPLYRHIVRTLLASGRVDEVVIDTDSNVIARDAAGVERVRILERPAHLRDGLTAMNDILLHDVAQVEADFYLQTHSTNPLLRPETVSAALDAFITAPDNDSLFTVTALRTRLYWPDGRAINHDPAVLLRTQDLPPVYEENSCPYLFTRASLERHGSRIGAKPLLHEIDAEEAIDIDVELDFRIAETVHTLRQARVAP